MIVISAFLLAALTLAPAGVAQRAPSGPASGFIQSGMIPAANSNCKAGAICASVTTKIHGCYVVNFYTSSKGGTPLAIDVTQTGGKGTPTYIYWVNNTNKTLTIKGSAYAKYYCP